MTEKEKKNCADNKTNSFSYMKINLSEPEFYI